MMPDLRLQLRELLEQYQHNLSQAQVLDFATKAADLAYSHVVSAQTKEDKSFAKQVCEALLARAERVKQNPNYVSKVSDLLVDIDVSVPPLQLTKSSRAIKPLQAPASKRNLTNREEILLLQGSKLNDGKYPPWKVPGLNEFLPSPDGQPFRDPSIYDLSPEQLSMFDRWMPPEDALGVVARRLGSSKMSPNETNKPIMKNAQAIDLVQDAATDCSLVSSLSALAARSKAGHGDLLASVIYPWDYVNSCPAISPTGKYIVRLNFNGCDRRVDIDDLLPVSNSSRIMHVVDRNNAFLLWPALLEKAFLKIQGGYDFPGSNSGTDLLALTGWIPEQVFLQSDSVEPELLWKRLRIGLSNGDVLATIGTGDVSERTRRELGLVGFHDYAILGLKVQQDRTLLLIKNPWLSGDSWKEYHIREPLQDFHQDIDALNLDSDGAGITDIPGPGSFWMDTNDVLQNFSTVYLNWNPALFTCREDVHFSWLLDPSAKKEKERFDFVGCSPVGSLMSNPQFTVTSEHTTDVWILLSRHVIDKPKTGSRADGYISLYAFDAHGKRVQLQKGHLAHSTYSDSPQSLLRLSLQGGRAYTIAVSQQELRASSYVWSLSAFSNTPASLKTAAPAYANENSIIGTWSEQNAGGNTSRPSYVKNPQFNITLGEPSPIALMLETSNPSVNVNVRLFRTNGTRVHSIGSKDLIQDSGAYTRHCAFARNNPWEMEPAGSYTAIVSTYEAGEKADFRLWAMANARLTLATIGREGAGLICTQLIDAQLGYDVKAVAAPFAPRRLTRIHFTAKVVTQPGTTASPIRIALEQGKGPDRRFLVASGGGAYADTPTGIRTEPMDVGPALVARDTVWLTVSRMGGPMGPANKHETVRIEMWADAADAVQIGVWRDRDT